MRLTDVHLAPLITRNNTPMERRSKKGLKLAHADGFRSLEHFKTVAAAFGLQMNNNVLMVQVD